MTSVKSANESQRTASAWPIALTTFVGDAVAHALMRAASALLPTLGSDTVLPTGDGVEMSLDTARMSACATAPDGL